jgi:hypothetical protein
MTKKINNRLENGINNYNKVLNIIINSDGISRTEIANLTGLSASSVTNITSKLRANNLIKESELIQSDNVGRKAVQLRLNSLGGFFICMVFCERSIKLDFYNLEKRRGTSLHIPIRDKVITAEFIIENIEEEVQYNYKYGRFFGITLVLPSFVFKKGDNGNFGYQLEDGCIDKIRRFYAKTKVLIEPSCVVGAYRLVERNVNKNILCVEINRGIASSVILSGKFLDGNKFSFNLEEFIVVEDGVKNVKDCVANERIEQKYAQLTGEKIPFENICENYFSGEENAINAVFESIKSAVVKIKELIGFMSVDYLVVSGEKIYCHGLKDCFKRLYGEDRKLKIITIDDDEDLSIGGVLLAFDTVFSY